MTQRKIKNGEIESQEAQQELAEYERMLNDAKYKEQHEAWKNYKKQNRASYPKWFNITSNPHSKGIHALLSSLDPDLGIIYNYMSVEAHGSGVTNKLLAVNDKLGMHLLRRPYGLASCVNYCLTSQCRVYSFFVERYLSKEDDDNLLCWFEQRAKEMDELLVLGRKFDEKQHR